MKKTLLLAAAVLALTACSNDNEPQAGDNQGAARFSATIGTTQSRAFDQTWEKGDKIGITGTTGAKTYTNVAYVTSDGSGNFSVLTEGSDIYYQDDNEVTFTAYYPYAGDAGSISADTKKQTKQKSFDYLWSQATGKKAQPHVAFSFAHKMTKVAITIKKGADVSFDEVKNAVLNLGGVMHIGNFNVTTGVATATGGAEAFDFANGNAEDKAPFKIDDTNETITYTLIFWPQEFTEAIPFTATIADKQSFSANLGFLTANSAAGDAEAKNAWVAGRQYNLSVTLNKTKLTVNRCTIEAWKEAEGGNFDAE